MPCTSHSSIVKDSSANAAHVGVGSPVVSDKPSEDARRHKIQVEAACVGLWIQTSPAIGFGRLSEDNPLELSQDLTRVSAILFGGLIASPSHVLLTSTIAPRQPGEL